MRFIVSGSVLAMLILAALPAGAGGRPLSAELASANEVGGGDGSATGSAAIELNQGLGEVCFEISTEGLTTEPIAAHIHVGPAGENGPVVVNFDWAANGSGAGAAGCVAADAALIKDIRQHPSAYYVNVHNPTVPSGAVRGQLAK